MVYRIYKPYTAAAPVIVKTAGLYLESWEACDIMIVEDRSSQEFCANVIV